MLAALPPVFASTRSALHAVAEHVLSPARHRVEGRIGLRPVPGGFGTPPFGDAEEVRVEGAEIVHVRDGAARRALLTTIADAAAFVGVEPGAPAGVYEPNTPLDPNASLDVDALAAGVLAEWFAFADRALGTLVHAHADAAPAEVTLWPEHFDLGTTLGDEPAGSRANYGASPGDDTIGEPYLYVGPWSQERRVGPFAVHPWGSALTYSELRRARDPLEQMTHFFADAARRLSG